MLCATLRNAPTCRRFRSSTRIQSTLRFPIKHGVVLKRSLTTHAITIAEEMIGCKLSTKQQAYVRGAVIWGSALGIGNLASTLWMSSFFVEEGIPKVLEVIFLFGAQSVVKSLVYGALWPITAPWLLGKILLNQDDQARWYAVTDAFVPGGSGIWKRDNDN